MLLPVPICRGMARRGECFRCGRINLCLDGFADMGEVKGDQKFTGFAVIVQPAAASEKL